MNLQAYFSEHSGIGVLSTADGKGMVDAAIFSRPHVMEDGTLAMVMRDRLTHKNLQENPHAVYLFIEATAGYQGVRLFLKKIGEDNNQELIEQMTRRTLTPEEDKAKGPKFMVYFSVEQILKLIRGEEK
ncbi:pyridoxamine 5'-phosphate oxidase family protein [Malonomonas rubra]|uniref:pyridoxamine 5'-phosphate oxidase family protein n=1 Tax=Malonomonas rubra TaxID=57040 RepID=UPI0026ED04AC|nr:pyridoxamine 5'-phosphate oxidase family protein [Malonomonas rubra]